MKARAAREAIPLLQPTLGDWIKPLIEQATPDADGAIVLPLIYDSLEYARERLLALGTLLEVIEPEELRESICDHATRVIAFYTERRRTADIREMETAR